MDEQLRDFLTVAAFGEFAERVGVDYVDILTPETGRELDAFYSDKFPSTAENETIASEFIRQVLRDSVERLLSGASE